MVSPDSWLRPAPQGRGLAPHAALIVMTDPRAVVVTTLLLHELGYTVDAGAGPDAALDWLRHARYDAVVVGDAAAAQDAYLARIRAAAGDAQVVAMTEAVDVNEFMRLLWPHER